MLLEHAPPDGLKGDQVLLGELANVSITVANPVQPMKQNRVFPAVTLVVIVCAAVVLAASVCVPLLWTCAHAAEAGCATMLSARTRSAVQKRRITPP